MAATVTLVKKEVRGSSRVNTYDITPGAYATGGVALTAAQVGLKTVNQCTGNPQAGLLPSYDRTNAKLQVFDKPWPNTTVSVKDDDNAASNGVAVYVHVDEVSEQGSAIAHLEFVSPTNADGTGLTRLAGQTYYIQDDDAAASGGVALYLDEDATLGSRFLANTGRDCNVLIGGGRAIKVTANATPGTPGVQVYFDEDAANAYERLQFVSPTNTTGSETSLGEVNDAVDLTAVFRLTFEGV